MLIVIIVVSANIVFPCDKIARKRVSLSVNSHMSMNRIILSLFFVLSCLGAAAQDATEAERAKNENTAAFSLVTCAPGEVIYTLFGHSGIRYRDAARGIDIVYNYGLFSFESSNFIWRFVTGEPDYALGAMPYSMFLKEYVHDNRAVWEQQLDLLPQEEDRLLRLLETNRMPENRIYRYNIFYDNCATRPRDIIETSVDGKVVYEESAERRSFRDIVYESTVGYDWSRFGMDFCLGAKADEPITYRQEMFSPMYLQKAFAKATIVSPTGESRPMVTGENTLVNPPVSGQSPSWLITPMITFVSVFLCTLAISIYGMRKQKSTRWLDALLFGVAGLGGCVVFFLNFFSAHPTVSPNYLLAAFHPLHLLCLPFFVRKPRSRFANAYHTANCTVLTLFILLYPIIPQHFNPAVLPLALGLLTRSAANLLLIRQNRPSKRPLTK